MTNLPPPSPNGPPEGSDGRGGSPDEATAGLQPQPYVSPPPPTPPARSKWLIPVAIAAAVAIGGAAFAIVTDDDDAGTTSDTAVTTAGTGPPPSTSALPATTTSSAPATTQPPATTTTLAATTTSSLPADDVTTTAPPPTVPAIPEGSADLGNGVALPIPDGYVQTNPPGSMVTLTDNTSVIVANSAVRTPGIDPALVTQEYVSAFDSSFPTISYGPTAKNASLSGEPATDIYTTFFLTFDDATAVVQSGFISVYIRGDGLVLVVSAYGPNGYPGVLPSASVNAMNTSFQATPAVGPSSPLNEIPPFRVATVHTPVVVDGLVAFTAAPGFAPYGEPPPGRAMVSNGIEDVQADRLTGQADTSVVTASAQAIIGENYSDLTYSELALGDPDPFGVVHGAFSWTGSFSDGRRSAGIVDFYFDPSTSNAYVLFRNWFSGSDDSEPFPAASQFMLQSLFNSFTGIA